MKKITIPFKESTLTIILSGTIKRHYRWVKMSCIGRRFTINKDKELDGRITHVINVNWRWFPFVEFLHVKDIRTDFQIFSNDPFPVKCFVEYEFWKYRHGKFNANQFVHYMKDKYKMTEDEIMDGCHAIMLTLHDKDGVPYDGRKK